MGARGKPKRPDEVLQIPGYEMLGELGRGGMGVVYQARHLRLGRPVALKMILAGRGVNFLELARFRVEAEAVACLRHPNILRIQEVGVHQGFPYLALEYADGGSLAKPLRPHPRAPRRAAEVVRSLADAMQHAHERGILHRDLKPANILLLADGTPKIADFGLAKFQKPMREVSDQCATVLVTGLDSTLVKYFEEYRQKSGEQGAPSFEKYAIERTWHEVMGGPIPAPKAEDMKRVKEFVDQARRQAETPLPAGLSDLCAELTREGTILGSPSYMAPEQACGDQHSIGPAADIYALGGILYQLLSGCPPFQGATLGEVLEKVKTEPPPPLAAAVNQELEAICLRCLEKDVVQRYATAAELAADLGRYLGGYRTVAAERGPSRPSTIGPAVPVSGDVPSTWFGPAAPPTPKAEAPSTLAGPLTSLPDPLRTRTWWQFWK